MSLVPASSPVQLPGAGTVQSRGPQQDRVSQVRQSRRLAEACSVPGLGSALCSEEAYGLAPMETACQPELAGTGLAASADGATAR